MSGVGYTSAVPHPLRPRRNRLLPPCDQHRCTGRTTAIALEALSRAIRAPGVQIVVRDHYEGPPRNAATVMYEALRRCEKALGLQHIEVRINTEAGTCTVTSNIWE